MGAGARALGAKGPEMWKEGGEPLSGNTGQRGAGLASFTPSLVLSPLAPCLAPTTQPTPHTPKRGFQSPAGTTPILPWTTPTLPFISFSQRSLGRAPPGQGPPRGLPTAAQSAPGCVVTIPAHEHPEEPRACHFHRLSQRRGWPAAGVVPQPPAACREKQQHQTGSQRGRPPPRA